MIVDALPVDFANVMVCFVGNYIEEWILAYVDTFELEIWIISFIGKVIIFEFFI